MHVLIFTGILLGIIGWFAFWTWSCDWEVGEGFFVATFAAIGLFLVGLLGWVLWTLTAGIH